MDISTWYKMMNGTIEAKDVMEYNEKMKDETDRHKECMEMKNMYEDGMLER